MTVRRWQPVSLAATATPWPQRLDAVIVELHVGSNPRYRPGPGTQTWCNVYLTDVVAGMGIATPRHWMTSKGDPAAVGRGREMRANDHLEWFRTHGARYGWAGADQRAAELAAQRGHLAVVGWSNPSGPGHVAVVLGPDAISQAGRVCFAKGRVAQGFGKASPLEWWVQMERGGPPHADTHRV